MGNRTDGYTTNLPSNPYAEKRFQGWSDCGCDAGFRPGIVLDPFVGSGTACMVAQKLGRKWIGIDLKSEYVEMAKQRIRDNCSQKLWKWMKVKT